METFLIFGLAAFSQSTVVDPIVGGEILFRWRPT
jgi:hypothetical protein